MTDLAAALIAGVKRYDHYDDDYDQKEQGAWVTYADVLAALTAALDPAIAEQAGEVLEGVTPGPWTLSRLADQTPHSIQASYGCVNGLSALFTLAHINVPDEAEVGMTDGAFDRETAEANARFIAGCREGVPALLTQNAFLLAEINALRAERDRQYDENVHRIAEQAKAEARAEAAEAEVEKLRAELDYASKEWITHMKQAAKEQDRAGKAEAEVERLREAADWQEKHRRDAFTRRHIHAPEDPHVAVLCERYGYGAVMDAASRLWARKDSVGAFYIGGCIGIKPDAALTTEADNG